MLIHFLERKSQSYMLNSEEQRPIKSVTYLIKSLCPLQLKTKDSDRPINTLESTLEFLFKPSMIKTNEQFDKICIIRMTYYDLNLLFNDLIKIKKNSF